MLAIVPRQDARARSIQAPAGRLQKRKSGRSAVKARGNRDDLVTVRLTLPIPRAAAEVLKQKYEACPECFGVIAKLLENVAPYLIAAPESETPAA